MKKAIETAYASIVRELNKKSSKARKLSSMRFFKTGKGQYGEGDVFIGVTVPDLRKVALKYLDKISEEETRRLLKDDIHEYRYIALMILVYKFNIAHKKEDEIQMRHIYKLYTSSFTYINNWDLVDTSARDIVGAFCFDEHSDKGKKYFTELTSSLSLWKRRIAVISTHYHIKKESFDIPLYIVKKLLNDDQDLIHKACGWTLRELGRFDRKRLIKFLDSNSTKMPRTMLRYAIEHFDKKMRTHYLKSSV